MRSFLGAVIFVTVGACAAPLEEEAMPVVGVSGYRCSVEGLGDLIGRPATVELGSDALRRSGSRLLRWIRPGDVVTMDYRPDRLNVRLDGQNRVESFTCG